jgi:protoporphyrinogen oxidase
MDIAIVGAGLTGLTAALDLAAAGHRVTVFEQRQYAGGLSAGFRDRGWDWPLDRFYHHWFASDEHVTALIGELGATERVEFRWPTTSMLYQGRLYPLDSPVQALRFLSIPAVHRAVRVLQFTPLPLIDRLRVGLAAFYLTVVRDWERFEGITADSWLRRAVGARAYGVWWKPLLVSKFGEEYCGQVNMAWLWARAYKRTARLGYFEGGFQGFVDLLVEAARARGGKVELSTAVTRVSALAGGGLEVQAPGHPRSRFDRVVATCSPKQLASLAPVLPQAYRESLLQLRSMGAVALVLALDRPLTDGHYWINIPAGEGIPFMGLIEHTNFIPPERYGGDHLVYCGDYVAADDPRLDFSHDELLAAYLPGLVKINPAFSLDWVRACWAFSEAYAQPVPLVNQSRRLPTSRTPIQGLWMANMSLVYPWDRGSNYAIEMGRRVAREVMA